MYPFILKQNSITVFIKDNIHTVTSDALNYETVLKAIKTGTEQDVEDALTPVKAINNYLSSSEAVIKDGVLFYRGQKIENLLTEKIIAMHKEGFKVEPMIKFFENLMQNPSMRAVQELYTFIEKANLPITDDGSIIAFKKVRADFMDIYSGTVLHKPAKLMTKAELSNLPLKNCGLDDNVEVSLVDGMTRVSMPRNGVDDDADRTCSSGLHFCSREYLSSFGWGDTKVIVVKVNPAHVVSIPSDYNATKGRTCEYTIIDVMSGSAGDYEGKQVIDVKCDHDKNGRPLSMTPNAIRMRAFRAAQKANK